MLTASPRRCAANNFIVVILREWQGRSVLADTKKTIAAAIREQGDPSFTAQPETIAEMLARARTRTGRPVAVFLDQFEDYLRCHVRTYESDSCDAELGDAAADRRSWFVIAMQEHAEPELRRLEQYIPSLFAFEMKLGPLNPAGAKEVVTQAGEAAGIVFEPAAVEALVSASAAALEKGVHPFYLMAGVGRLLDAGRARKWTSINPRTIQIYGGADRLILESLDRTLGPLTTPQNDLLFRWVPLLISDSDQRLAVTAEALREGAGESAALAAPLITALTELGILRSIEVSGTVRYELARDSFALLLRDWRTRYQSRLMARHRSRFIATSVLLVLGLLWCCIWCGSA